MVVVGMFRRNCCPTAQCFAFNCQICGQVTTRTRYPCLRLATWVTPSLNHCTSESRYRFKPLLTCLQPKLACDLVFTCTTSTRRLSLQITTHALGVILQYVRVVAIAVTVGVSSARLRAATYSTSDAARVKL